MIDENFNGGDEAVETTTTTETTPESSGPLDLSTVEKFKFDGQEWTPNDFKSAYMRHKDYTQKTQEISQERSYYDNLKYDLDAVKSNPQLASKFREIYPEKFHNYLEYLGANSKQESNIPQGIDPKFYEDIQSLKEDMNNRRVSAAQAELDAKFQTFSKKYPLADEEAVIARASYFLDKGEKLTDKHWEGIWKTVNERNQKIADQYYSQKISQQKKANTAGADIGSGGGIPGKGPRVAKSIKEATDMFLSDLDK